MRSQFSSIDELRRANPMLYQSAFSRGYMAAKRQQGRESCPWQRDSWFCQMMREIFESGYAAGSHEIRRTGRKKE